MIPTKDLRSFVGKLSWISGIVPRFRWTVTALYAVLKRRGLKKRGHNEIRPAPQNRSGGAEAHGDNNPMGQSGVPGAREQAHQADRWRSSSSRRLGRQSWKDWQSFQGAAVLIRSDSSVALAMAKKLSSSTKTELPGVRHSDPHGTHAADALGASAHPRQAERGSRLAFAPGRSQRDAGHLARRQSEKNHGLVRKEPGHPSARNEGQSVVPWGTPPTRGVRQSVKNSGPCKSAG